MEAISLLELNAMVRESIEDGMPGSYWVQAELSDVRSNSTGHCFLEFIQKEESGNRLLAKARGIIWSNTYHVIRPYFEQTTGQAFVSGIKVLVQVSVTFSELYGYSLVVEDIDPTYTLGDMAQRRREILAQLREDGVIDMNRELPMPMLPRRVAVISSATAAGYGDFCHQLENNVRGYCFQAELFPALMQGDGVERSILNALDAIMARADDFDVVVIIRGGGATSDLSGFDTYMLAASCAQFPLPIITGIGHERDDTVLDAVAHTRVKTPTAAAEYLINCMDEAAAMLYNLVDRLHGSTLGRLKEERQRLALLAGKIPSAALRRVSAARLALLNDERSLCQAVSMLMERQHHRLDLLAQYVRNASPERLLARGYSITVKDGRVVKDAASLLEGDVITTRLRTGEVQSVVRK